MNRSLRLLLGLALICCASLHARAEAQDITRLFPHEADITAIEGDTPDDGTYVRLPLSPEVLGQVREDFSDIRIFNEYGSTVPFTIDRATGPSTRLEATVFEPIVAYNPVESTAREGGVTRATEFYQFALPHRSQHSGDWVLEVHAAPGVNFVRQYVVYSDGAVRGEIARGAIYQFAQGGRTTIRMPALRNANFTLELRGEGMPLRPTFLIGEESSAAIAPPTALVPLTIASTRVEGTESIYVVNCPEGFPMEAFELETTTAAFVRRANVSVVDARGTRTEGSALLVRVPNASVPEALLIPTSATGRSVEIRVENQDSPPLEGLVIRARIRVPSLILEYHPREVMRWGGGRARQPNFDVMNYAVESFQQGGHNVRLSITRPNPVFDNTPLLATSMRAGAVIDTTRFTHEASLTVPESVDGIVRFDVPPEMWAAARSDLADLRIVDAAGAQWPYLTGQEAEVVSIPLTVQAPTAHATEPHTSVHQVVLPLANVMPRTLHFTLPLQPVSRGVRVIGTHMDGTETELGTALWVGNGTDQTSFEIWVNALRVRGLRLEIENGDEAPLALQTGTLDVDGHRLFVVAAPGSYRVLVGSSESAPPNYDLALFADTVLMLRVEEGTLGPLSANAAYHEPTWIEASGWQTVAASAALGLVVLLLFALTLRIVRSESKPSSEENKASTSENKAPSRDLEAPSRDLEAPSRDLEAPSRDLEAPSRDLEAPTSGSPKEEGDA
jgi:hypothetical protein